MKRIGIICNIGKDYICGIRLQSAIVEVRCGAIKNTISFMSLETIRN
nr:MAG TPA: hypothetical protein [Caudoviricetes sp.]